MQKVAIVGCGAYMDSGYGCPYGSAEDMARILKNKTDINVVLGTHEYH